MAIVTRQEFADMNQIDVKVLNVHVSRKKVASLPDKRIDTENPLNKLYVKNLKKEAKIKLEKAKVERKAAKKFEPSDIPEEKRQENYEKTVEIFTKPETKQQKEQRQKQNEADQESIDWDLRKKKADALKAEQQAEKEKLNVEKLLGKLMPVELVELIIAVNLQHVFKSFENDLINLASIYCDILAGGNREKLSEIIEKIRHKLTDLIQRTSTTAAQEVENAIEDYAEVRNRGERK